MEKIKLSKAEKILLKKIEAKHSYANPTKDEQDCLCTLDNKGFVTGSKNEQGKYICVNLTDAAKSYLIEYPKLNNPSIWDDKKYLINTAISVIAIAISVIALYISIGK